jgi:hypothetical protein
MLFFSEQPDYIVDPHPDRARRELLTARLLAATPLEPAERAYLSQLGRPLVLVAFDGTEDEVALAAAYGRPAFTAPGVAAYRLPP